MVKNNKKGFTLVELLVVIAIIAILVVLILVALGVARQKARDSQRKTDVRSIVTALELYADDHGGTFPADQDALYSTASDGMAKYLPSMPHDPSDSTKKYGYAAGKVGTDAADLSSYVLCVNLEQPGTATNPYYQGNGSSDDTLKSSCDGTL